MELSGPPSQQDFSDLPFDMPKLRRRRMLPEVACTSGSATSVDFRDLPFDMPKLRRRMRLQQPSNLETSASQASSSQSVVENDRQGEGFFIYFLLTPMGIHLILLVDEFLTYLAGEIGFSEDS